MCRASRPSVTGSVLLRKRSPGSSSSFFSFSPPSACLCHKPPVCPRLNHPVFSWSLYFSEVSLLPSCCSLGPFLIYSVALVHPLRPPHLDGFFPLAAWTLFYCEVSCSTGTFQTHYRNVEKERIPSQLLLTFGCVYSCSPHFLVFYPS